MSKNDPSDGAGMDAKGWIAIIGSLSTALIAVLVSLYQLGPSAPGVVLGLLLCSALLGIIIIQERHIALLMQDAQKREDNLLEQAKAVVLAMQLVTTNLSELADNMSMQSTLAKWQAEITARALVDSTKAIADALAVRVVDTAKDVATEMQTTARGVAREALAVAKEVKDSGQS